MYITEEEYNAIYGPVENFQRHAFESGRVMDIHTTGADNVKKLKVFFPTEKDDVEAVKHCAAKLIHLFSQIEEAEKSASSLRGYEQTEHGARGRVVSSVSAGNESISYSSVPATDIDKAVYDKSVRNSIIYGIIRDYLSGINDSNGVCLLYMGPYPRRFA